MPGPSEEEERLKSEVKQLRDELEKSKRGTLTSQRGQDGELILLPLIVHVHSPSLPPLSLSVLVNIVALYLFRSSIKDKDAGESRSFIEEWEEPADGAGFWAKGVLEF